MTYKSIEYVNWNNMMHRCYDPNTINYSYYGGRGIRVCPAWHNFDAFLADMGPRPTPHHTIDRIDHDGDYTPDPRRRITYDELRAELCAMPWVQAWWRRTVAALAAEALQAILDAPAPLVDHPATGRRLA